eukprot:TRINITY_DN8118_c0_g1_i2.p1 TRINITY_DN8118_c0_g1~~TRINITY_DN8118_c0_g1_i2.p1  ORF type:complete len:135 (+),score=9.08 TRINITY_DN8118_c0_g1_i2:133-537(+)
MIKQTVRTDKKHDQCRYLTEIIQQGSIYGSLYDSLPFPSKEYLVVIPDPWDSKKKISLPLPFLDAQSEFLSRTNSILKSSGRRNHTNKYHLVEYLRRFDSNNSTAKSSISLVKTASPLLQLLISLLPYDAQHSA